MNKFKQILCGYLEESTIKSFNDNYPFANRCMDYIVIRFGLVLHGVEVWDWVSE